ncbi:MAG: hypothetical protein K2X61_11270 [Caulobacteraceae bacterium]|nr:hypothetical protein [Caulobacteraceae bacterium]
MSKRVTVHYRRLVDRNFHDVVFRPAFEAGLAASINGVRLGHNDATRITVSGDGHRMCLLSPHADDNFCFGEIAVFRDGDVPVAETDPGGQVHLRTIPLAGNEEAIRGSTYFMAVGPHVALLHHDSSTRFLEDYLRWLMRAPLGNLAADEMLNLQPMIDMGGRPVAVRDIKSLKLRAEVVAPALAPAAMDGDDRRPQTFARMIERQQLTGGNVRAILHALGLSNGTLQGLNDRDLQDLEFELLVRKRENNRIQPLPDELVRGVINDGVDRAAEFEADGAKRRGDAIVARYATEVDVEGAYYALNSVRAALWGALGEWRNQELI